MTSLGNALLALAFLSAVAAAAIALAGRNGERRWIDLSRRVVYGFCALVTICVVIIEIAFAGNDFSFNIVAQHSSIETPTFYKLAAMWSSQEGSLLLWAWVLSIVSSLALLATRNKLREIVPWATAVMMGVAAFFTGLMLFAPDVNPFAHLSPAPADGIGLNPLLQHPSMMIHPPMLYSGYVSLTVPFAFAIGDPEGDAVALLLDRAGHDPPGHLVARAGRGAEQLRGLLGLGGGGERRVDQCHREQHGSAERHHQPDSPLALRVHVPDDYRNPGL